ncbi:MAG: hypothetical protein KIT31_13455 [Deltaproteobacteria bacterium]|nr:hypothetical protein [Deltaproteobacteria bacterium]
MKLAAAVALALLCPTIAFAEDVQADAQQLGDVPSPFAGSAPAPPGLVPVRPEPLPAPEDPIVAQGRIVAAGQGLYVGSAITTPANQLELGLATVPPFGGLLALSAGLGGTTELRAEVGGTIEDAEGLSGFGFGLKQVIGRGRTWSVALAGSIHQLRERHDAGQRTLYAVGGIATIYGDDCGVMFSGGLHMLGLNGEDEKLMMLTLGLSAGSKTTRFLAELTAGGEGHDNLALGFLGIRMGNRTMALDLGLAMLFGDGNDAPVLPIVSVHSRL